MVAQLQQLTTQVIEVPPVAFGGQPAAQVQTERNPRRIGMVTYSHFLSDARVRRYAEALGERGDNVDVISLRGLPTEPDRERLGNVHLVRMQDRIGKKEKSRASFLLPVLRFVTASGLWLARHHRRQPYDLLHIHNVPDFLVFSGWYPKRKGAGVILDIHDILPEFYGSKFSAGDHSPMVRFLKLVERCSANFADHVIISNDLWRQKYAARTRTESRCSVFINNVDNRIFRPIPRTRVDGRIVIIFPGGLQWHQGLDIAIRAFKTVVGKIPHAEFHIYGEGDRKPSLVKLARELGLEERVRFFGLLPVHEVARLMANSDLGVVPKRADSFGNEAYSTKIMEFMSVGVPVVVSSTKIDRYYFGENVVRFFESGNVEALSAAILQVLGDESLRGQMVSAGLEYARVNGWESRKREYLALVDSLIGRGAHAAGRA